MDCPFETGASETALLVNHIVMSLLSVWGQVPTRFARGIGGAMPVSQPGRAGSASKSLSQALVRQNNSFESSNVDTMSETGLYVQGQGPAGLLW